MRIVIVGGHGSVAMLLGRRLSDAGHEVTGLIRKAEQSDELRDHGMEPVEHDIETGRLDDLVEVVRGHDVAVFAAGAGPGSGAARKETVDFAGAVKLTDACLRAGVDRYVMISAMGTDDPPMDSEVFSVYLRAKKRADDHLMDSDLGWTVVRPGALTDEEATGTVTAARHVDQGEISRADVAHVLAEVITNPDSARRLFEVVGGDTPVAEAVASLGEDTRA